MANRSVATNHARVRPICRARRARVVSCELSDAVLRRRKDNSNHTLPELAFESKANHLEVTEYLKAQILPHDRHVGCDVALFSHV